MQLKKCLTQACSKRHKREAKHDVRYAGEKRSRPEVHSEAASGMRVEG